MLKSEAASFFQNLFASPIASNPYCFPVNMHPRLSQEGTNSLLAEVCKEEVRTTVFSMKSYKAPGSDGFQPIFFKKFWNVVGDDLWSLVKNAFNRGYSDVSLAEILIVLIPKVDNPLYLKEFTY